MDMELKQPIVGTFICFGKEVEPQVHMLDAVELQRFTDRVRVAETRTRDPQAERRAAYKFYFAAGIEYVLAAWNIPALVALIEGYDGLYRDRIRQLAACLLTGTSTSGDKEGKDADGGQRAPIDPVKPKPTKPGGGARAPRAPKAPVPASV
jgi:hypothetical protein